MAAIIRDGLDPARRNGQSQGTGEYFADDPATSVPFCQGRAVQVDTIKTRVESASEATI